MAAGARRAVRRCGFLRWGVWEGAGVGARRRAVRRQPVLPTAAAGAQDQVGWGPSVGQRGGFCGLIRPLPGQGTPSVEVCLQRAGRGPPLAAVHLGWGLYRRHAAFGGPRVWAPVSPGGEGPPAVHVFVGDSHVHLQR